jgi:ribonuclease-3
MNAFDLLIENIAEIESLLGYHFSDPALLALAFVHRSYINEHKEITHHNERLEFLGDSVLGLIVASFLYRKFPLKPEGELSSLRSRLVDSPTCMNFVLRLKVEKFLLLGKGERLSDGRGRESILGDLFEAVIGAIYLDGGLEAASSFFMRNFGEEINRIIDKPINNWKALFQDYCQRTYQQTPVYHVKGEVGPDHSKIFTMAVSVNGQEMGMGQGGSKKDAQQAAAENAVTRLKQEI